MLTEQTFNKLRDMKLNGMAACYERMQTDPASAQMSFQERFAMLVDSEHLDQQNRALIRRLNYASLKQDASIEAINWRVHRGIDRAVMDQLSTCEWIRYGQNCIITGATGLGKSWLACALAQKACREGYRVLYQYCPRLFRDMLAAEADGSFTRMVRRMARIDLLIIDDWGLEAAERAQYRSLLELLDEGAPPQGQLILLNLVDFDMLWGHRCDPVGFKGGLEAFDAELPHLLARLGEQDLLVLTADHGNDPTGSSTDHSREYVPLLALWPGRPGRELGTRSSFTDVGATLREWLGLPVAGTGQSFLAEMG